MVIADTDLSRGCVLRIVNAELAYVLVTDTSQVLQLTLSDLANYRGETFDELGLYDDSPIELRIGAAGLIEDVSVCPKSS
jgi:hypothetical protein